jgi:predicted dehydrogenase
MSKTTRWGIVGTGTVAALFAEGLVDAEGAKLAVVASRSRERADAFAAAFGAERAYGGENAYESLARDPSVELVYVATPNSEHRAHALMLLEAGKGVLCEKPFAMNAAEARDIAAAARNKRVFCMEAMWMRFVPAVVDFVDRVRGGAVGEPQSATIELGHPFVFDARHRLFDPALGGGALLDLGVYAVSLAVALFGPAIAVQGQAVLGPSGVDEHTTALLGHAGGRQSVLGASLRTRLSNAASVAGSGGWATLREPLYRPSALRITAVQPQTLPGARKDVRPPSPKSSLRRALSAVMGALPPSLRDGGHTLLRPYRGNAYNYEAVEAMRCLRAGLFESPRMPLDDTLHVMEIVDSIRNSWKVL